VMRRITDPPVALCTNGPTESSLNCRRSRMTRLSGVISGVTLRDNTAFLNAWSWLRSTADSW